MSTLTSGGNLAICPRGCRAGGATAERGLAATCPRQRSWGSPGGRLAGLPRKWNEVSTATAAENVCGLAAATQPPKATSRRRGRRSPSPAHALAPSSGSRRSLRSMWERRRARENVAAYYPQDKHVEMLHQTHKVSETRRAAQHLTETHLEAQGLESHRWTRGARNVPEDNFRDTRMHCQHR